jgi:hypothetical protein
MTPPRTPPPGQLNVPLVWEHGREQSERETLGDSPSQPSAAVKLAGTWRLWLGALADAGMVVLAAACGWVVAVAQGVDLGPAQLVLTGLAGVEVASVVALGCVWGWRASPGMLLAGVCFSRPIPWGRACKLWVWWLLSLVVLGFPLLIRLRGESVAERLAGGNLSFRSLPVGA